MTKEEIKEGNMLIAQFDGWAHTKPPKKGKGYWTHIQRGYTHWDLSAMKYHSSWDWLMRACKKWDSLNIKNKKYVDLCENLDHLVTLYDIEEPFKHFVKCVKWYNTQPLTKQ